jgi:hypothetical protein
MGWRATHALERPVPAAEGRARPAREGAVHAAPALGALLGRLDGERGLRVLDLGASVAANLERYSRFAVSVRFADLPRLLVAGEHPSSFSRGALARALPKERLAYDLLLCWDLLDHLSADDSRSLIARLLECSRPGTLVYAVTASSHTMSAHPVRFEIVGDEHLAYRTATDGTRSSPELPPAEVGRRLAPYVIERSVLLRHGVREHVAVLPADDAGAEAP